jgi:peptidoglycan/xylan/chitin deacetylase (PgdA/CDA1 family)
VKYAVPNGFTTASDFASYLIDAFDELRREGTDGRPALLSVGLHCRVSGRPARVVAVRRFLEHALASGDAWICTREEIAAMYHGT